MLVKFKLELKQGTTKSYHDNAWYILSPMMIRIYRTTIWSRRETSYKHLLERPLYILKQIPTQENLKRDCTLVRGPQEKKYL